ncbi:MAG: imidazole glycerol phosphate synthase subunit HisH, partial [Armatimonadota bacterium]
MIAIVDYGMGNLRSVEKAFSAVGHPAVITSDPETVAKAERVVLPGVGAFGAAIANLRASGMADAVVQAVKAGKPFLGICLGLQLLFDESDEMGSHTGLGVIPGRVLQFAPTPGLKIPHMGWNERTENLSAPALADF